MSRQAGAVQTLHTGDKGTRSHPSPRSIATNIRPIPSRLVLSLALFAPAFAASPVDINSADAQTLADGLNGIGMSKAQAIVAYRNEHGPFSSADQLAEVKGIGQALVEKNRDSIVVGGKAKAKAAPAG